MMNDSRDQVWRAMKSELQKRRRARLASRLAGVTTLACLLMIGVKSFEREDVATPEPVLVELEAPSVVPELNSQFAIVVYGETGPRLELVNPSTWEGGALEFSLQPVVQGGPW